jgi:hypothetical protein
MNESNLAMRFPFVALISFLVMLAGMIGASAQVTNRSEHQPIDCAASRLSVPGQYHCRLWSADFNARQRPRASHEGSISGEACTREQGSARIDVPQHFGVVRYVMLSPGAHFDCAVGGWKSINVNRMRSISPETRTATEIAFPQRSGDRFVSAFTSEKGLACRAFILLGPLEQNRYHNFDFREHRIEGYVCARDGAVLIDSAFEAFLGSIQFRPG